jgi:hypothetical protein
MCNTLSFDSNLIANITTNKMVTQIKYHDDATKISKIRFDRGILYTSSVFFAMFYGWSHFINTKKFLPCLKFWSYWHKKVINLFLNANYKDQH